MKIIPRSFTLPRKISTEIIGKNRTTTTVIKEKFQMTPGKKNKKMISLTKRNY